MAEQSDNSSTNTKPPLFPPNFVTLVQLKERWNREQERKQREKEEQEEQEEQEKQQRQREDEKKLKLVVEEGGSGGRRVKGERINRRKRLIRQSTPRNWRRKPEVLKLAVESAVMDVESQGLKDIKKKELRKRKYNKKGKTEDKARAENEEVIRGGENEEMIGGGENEEMIGSGENEEVIGGGENGEVIRGKEEAPSCQNVEKEIVPTTSAVTDVESQGLKDIKKKELRKRKYKKKGKTEDKARAENEEVIRGGENEEMIGSGENEEVIGGGENGEVIRGKEEAPSCQNVEKEIVPTRRERLPRGPRTYFRPTIRNASRNEIVVIEKKFSNLSVNGGNRRDHRYPRQKGYPNRGNSELGKDYWRIDRPSERNGTNAGKIWVKRGEVGDRNVVEIQGSSPL